MEIEIGQRFGMLVVKGEAEPLIDSRGQKCQSYQCICDCGNERTVRKSSLTSGMMNSCGCTAFPKQPLRDLSGEKFGLLTVISETDPYIDRQGKKLRRFRCRCDCGNETVTLAYSLKSGSTKSCGCLLTTHKLKESLVGQKFGRLTVISEAEWHVQKNGRRLRRWNCICDCGNETTVLQTNLLQKNGTKSCGCLSRRKKSKSRDRNRTSNLAGNRYGLLTVIAAAEPVTRKNGTKRPAWLCSCDCGNECIKDEDNLLSGHTRSCGCTRGKSAMRGKRFGKLTVLARANPGGKEQIWLCGCDCGNVIEASFDDLFWGSVTDCGCERKTVSDLTGQKFGRLTVLRPVKPAISPSGRSIRQWLCQCDCGREVTVRQDNLTRKVTRSCGCLRKKS